MAAWRCRGTRPEPAAWEPALVTWEPADPGPSLAPQSASVSTDEQVARAILSGRGLAAALICLGREARPEFAWRCEKAGTEITRVLDTYFEGADR